MSWRFDVIVIGAGQAGPPLAGRLTAAGMSVAVIERELFGVRHLDQHGWFSSGTTMARIGRGQRSEGSGGCCGPMRGR
jgi:flavin-dependent dehydrogenase